MNAHETRIVPLPGKIASEYAIVSMPRTAWYWLDEIVARHYPNGGIQSLVNQFPDKTQEGLISTLGDLARSYCEDQMAELYALANDNERLFPKPIKVNPGHPYTPDFKNRMPSVYQLFRFMPHATYLTTVWERRNYHLQGNFL